MQVITWDQCQRPLLCEFQTNGIIVNGSGQFVFELSVDVLRKR